MAQFDYSGVGPANRRKRIAVRDHARDAKRLRVKITQLTADLAAKHVEIEDILQVLGESPPALPWAAGVELKAKVLYVDEAAP